MAAHHTRCIMQLRKNERKLSDSCFETFFQGNASFFDFTGNSSSSQKLTLNLLQLPCITINISCDILKQINPKPKYCGRLLKTTNTGKCRLVHFPYLLCLHTVSESTDREKKEYFFKVYLFHSI